MEQLRDFEELVAAGRRSRAGGVGAWADVPRRHEVRELSGLYAVACDFWGGGFGRGRRKIWNFRRVKWKRGFLFLGERGTLFFLTVNRR